MKCPLLLMVASAFLSASGQVTSAGEKPIAVQMYTLRSLASLEEQVKAVYAAGVTAVETVSTQGVSAEALNVLFRRYSIKPISMHVSLGALRGDDFDALVAFNKEIGNRLLVVPQVSTPTDAAGWRALGRDLGEAAERVAAAGLTLAYHNHDFEFVEFDGKTGFDLLFEAASPALKAEIDVAWAARAGHAPAELIRKFSGRVMPRITHQKVRRRTSRALRRWGVAFSTGLGFSLRQRKRACSGISLSTTSRSILPRRSRRARPSSRNTSESNFRNSPKVNPIMTRRRALCTAAVGGAALCAPKFLAASTLLSRKHPRASPHR